MDGFAGGSGTAGGDGGGEAIAIAGTGGGNSGMFSSSSLAFWVEYGVEVDTVFSLNRISLTSLSVSISAYSPVDEDTFRLCNCLFFFFFTVLGFLNTGPVFVGFSQGAQYVLSFPLFWDPTQQCKHFNQISQGYFLQGY